MAERQLRFLSGVTGHDVSKIKPRCSRCGKAHPAKQPSAAVLAGALPAETAVPAPPDYLAVLRAARSLDAPRAPKLLLTAPALPTVSHLEALGASETVPSPAFEVLRDSLIAFRDGLTKKWRRK